MTNYYDLLEVSKNATTKEIQVAYERMKTLTNGTMWHPDWNGQRETYKMMRQIHEAHKVLTDKALREQYDVELLADTKRKLEEELKAVPIPPKPHPRAPMPEKRALAEPIYVAPIPKKYIPQKEHWLKRLLNYWIGK